MSYTLTDMELLDTKQAAVRLTVEAATLEYWRCIGVGPNGFKLRGRWRYDSRDLDSWVEEEKRRTSVRAYAGGKNVSLQAG